MAFQPEPQRGGQITVTKVSLCGSPHFRCIRIRLNHDQICAAARALAWKLSLQVLPTLIDANPENRHRQWDERQFPSCYFPLSCDSPLGWGGGQVTPRDPRSDARCFAVVLVLSQIKIRSHKMTSRLVFGPIITSEGLGVGAARGLKWVSQ